MKAGNPRIWKLTLLVLIAASKLELYAFEHKKTFFLGHPVDIMIWHMFFSELAPLPPCLLPRMNSIKMVIKKDYIYPYIIVPEYIMQQTSHHSF